MTSIQSNARCWKNLPRQSRSPLPFSCHSKMLPCSTASEQGESVVLWVSQMPQLLVSQTQKWPRVTPADMPSWRKDEMYHFYLLLRSLLASSEDTGVVTWQCFKEPNYCCWACQPCQCASARHSTLPAAFLAGSLLSSVPTVQQRLRTWALGSDGLLVSLTDCEGLGSLLFPDFPQASNSLFIRLGEQRATI